MVYNSTSPLPSSQIELAIIFHLIQLDCYLKDNEGDLAVDKAVVTEEEPVSTVDLFQAVTKANSGRIKKNLFIGLSIFDILKPT